MPRFQSKLFDSKQIDNFITFFGIAHVCREVKIDFQILLNDVAFICRIANLGPTFGLKRSTVI